MRFTHGIVTVAAIAALAGAARADTVDDLIAKNTAARGGEAKIRAIQTLRLTGKVKVGGGDFSFEGDYGMVQKRPGMLRTELSIQGLTQINAFDGKDGWQVSPFQGRRDPEKQSADDSKNLARMADLDGPLLGWKEKGSRVEALGTEDVDAAPAIKLRVTRKDGDVQYVYLDPDTMLEIKIVTLQKIRGVEHQMEVVPGSYQQVAGVWMPFTLDIGEKGGQFGLHVQIERAEVNVAVDDAAFKFPAAGASIDRVAVAGPPDKTAAATVAAPPLPEKPAVVDSTTISGLGARNIGSATMSGRIAAVAGRVEGGKTTLFVGAASGGVWRSLDGGTTFKPVFDKMPVQSIGAIAIDPSNAKNVWVGTGESWTRNSVSIGDGIYKSTDGGDTWSNVGLPESERITRILVHPRDGRVVYACVPGKLWSDSKDRGVYKTTDGGKSWALVLAGANLSTGCSGLTMDPKNPDVLLAGMWDFRRKGWTFRSGGDGPDAPSGSGLFRSTDGGKSWKAMTAAANEGLPAGPWGRVEVEYAPSDGKVVYALIESKDSALYRSADGGATWSARDKSSNMVWRPFYFARLVIDPSNPDRLFKPDLHLAVSEDGGNSFSDTGGGSHGDWHDLWIDPTNPKHVIGGDDGGLWLSQDGGNRWWKAQNLPVSQFYHVSIDAKDPYNVYGGLQDNSSWVGPSAYPGGITNGRWENLYGGDGFWSFVDPTDPDAVYAESQGGELGRVDRKTLSTRSIQPQADYKEKLRWNWNTPIAVSPTQKGTIYIGAQVLFRSRDRGDSWERISPDLTTNDPAKQKQEESGGVTVDNSSAEMHTTIYSISESPKNPNVIWVGTDDGNVQVTRDGGKHWTNTVAAVPGLPAASWVSWVEASRFDAGTAYAAFDRHTFGDMTPWVFKTTDYGKSWTRIVSPAQGVRGYAHVIREDAVARSLLFLGTELGLWVSVDGGATWAEFKGGNFPSVAVRDLAVAPRDGDLVIATHGRGIWIIDDLTPLRALSADTLAKGAAFLPERPVQQRLEANGGWAEGDASYAGENPPGGATITYYLRTRHVYGEIKLEILDGKGAVIDTVTPTKRRGINRVQWSMAVPPPKVPRAAQVAFGAATGPRVVPGTYTVRLTRGGQVLEGKLTITLDRRATFTLADRKAQFDAVMKAHALFGDMSKLLDRMEVLAANVRLRAGDVPAGDPLAKQLAAIGDKLVELRRMIVATKEGGAITGEERIREHLDKIYGAIVHWEGRPAKYQTARVEALAKELGDVQKGFDDLLKQVKGLDDALKAHKLDPIPAPAAAALEPAPLDEEARECIASRGLDCHPPEEPAAENDLR